MDQVEVNLVEELGAEAQLPRRWALPMVRNRGRCGYCGRDLVVDRLGYATAQIDHLLPQARYPDQADCEDNWVLSCALCNHTKSDWDPLDPDEKHDARQALERQRAELIRRAKCYIELRRMEAVDREWRTVRSVLVAHSQGQASPSRLEVVAARRPGTA